MSHLIIVKKTKQMKNFDDKKYNEGAFCYFIVNLFWTWDVTIYVRDMTILTETI
jgi:hypothetical protein